MENIYAGVSIHNYKPIFNWDHDNAGLDILSLTRPDYGTALIADIPVIYGYEFKRNASNADKKVFRDFIKANALTSEDVQQFIEYGILHLDNIFNLENLGYAVHPQSRTGHDIIELMGNWIMEYSHATMSDFELIKEAYQNVTFDAEKARIALRKRRFSEREIDRILGEVNRRFEVLKQTDKLFEIRSFLPREIRSGFMNYLRFATEDERIAYESLQGVDVLVYADLATSGSTLSEINRYLSAINPKNKLHSFVLLKQ